MRKLPTILSGIFISITLTRVANFADKTMGADWLGYVFAICLGVMVFISSYFNKVTDERKVRNSEDQTKHETVKSKRTRQVAFICMIFSIFADGLFNLAEVWQSLPDNANFLVQVSAAIYGIFPTVASALLGTLQGHVDKLPKSTSITWIVKIQRMIEKRIKDEPKQVKKLLEEIERNRIQHRKEVQAIEKQLKTIEQEKKVIEDQLSDLDTLIDNDIKIILNGATKKEKILAINRKWPGLPQPAIVTISGAVASQVYSTLKE